MSTTAEDQIHKESGDLAIAVAQLTVRAIGPNGVMIKRPEEDAGLLRAAFVARLSEAAMKVLDGSLPGLYPDEAPF